MRRDNRGWVATNQETTHRLLRVRADRVVAHGHAPGRGYLERRGLPADAVEHSGLDIVPTPTLTRTTLQAAGYSESEITGSNVLADSRWPGRLCGAWRNENGRIGTLWARALNGAEATTNRYLYLRGASRTNLPPYGLSEALAGSRDTRHELVVVEGVLDVHQLRSHGVTNVVALGGTSVRAEVFERFVWRP